MIVAGDVHGLWLIVMIDVIILTMLAFEHLRIEGRPTSRDPVDNARVSNDAAQ